MLQCGLLRSKFANVLRVAAPKLVGAGAFTLLDGILATVPFPLPETAAAVIHLRVVWLHIEGTMRFPKAKDDEIMLLFLRIDQPTNQSINQWDTYKGNRATEYILYLCRKASINQSINQ
eukprot:gb/GECG01011587.1/.p1 GENE.gb/GECG01011587.1/~~gb/GECG01011587.1/.p1  ORF type:complete len:119 (+),score=7.44 gb/GECG01011587.1/:1-357(+)